MKSNGLLKWLMIPFVLLAVFIGIKLLSRSDETATTSHGSELTQLEQNRPDNTGFR